MIKPMVLIVDDEPDILELIALTLNKMGIDTLTCTDLSTAKRYLSQYTIDCCLTDMRLPDGDGLVLVRYIQAHHPYIPVAVITAHGNMASAINVLKAGAFDFVSKPIELNVLRDLISKAIKLSHWMPANEQSVAQQLLGHSPAMVKVRDMIHKVARSQAPIFISGESGTGKELVARAIHAQGSRGDGPFIPVNCGAIPSELMESEFFGHKKGSFTGAHDNKEGLFQAAQHGSLFLDEVADLPMLMQVKLLRAIQEKTIRPIGAANEIPVDVRIISATHKPLPALVQQGLFRQDLFYRINVIEVHIPPLASRQEDIPIIAEHYLKQLSDGETLLTLSASAKSALMTYSFPGNIRELENCLHRASTLCENYIIEAADLALPETSNPPKSRQQENKQRLDPYLDELQKDAILQALEQTRWNKTAAAKLLGISFRALRYRLKKLGLDKMAGD